MCIPYCADSKVYIAIPTFRPYLNTCITVQLAHTNNNIIGDRADTKLHITDTINHIHGPTDRTRPGDGRDFFSSDFGSFHNLIY